MNMNIFTDGHVIDLLIRDGTVTHKLIDEHEYIYRWSCD